jgi:Rieske Fe-S protein
MSSTFPCRRRFLKMAAFGAAVAGCGSGSGTTQSSNTVGGGTSPDGGSPSGAPGDVAAGTITDLPVGSLKSLGSAPVAIARDGAGVYAMTLVCTHAGCEADVAGAEVICPCHGSTYDANGNVVHGPAQAGLTHFGVSADVGGNLTVHTDTVVDPTTRLSV